MNPETNPECKEYFDKLDLDSQITKDDYSNAIAAAHKARSMVCYLIWKEMKEQYPDIDADKIMIDAHEKFGIINGEKWGKVENAMQSIKAQSSKSGYLTFKQELIAYTEDYAQKNFGYCPHMDVIKKLGATDEEMKFFCQEILSAGDYGNMVPHPAVKLEWKKQIGAGDDFCEYCVHKVN